ncbi:MAG: GTPase domain-containing protein [Deltaproteobacteria bacterium]|nr:GTPase domain-containing protein [Deltaproteobacteria bacterium]
MQFNVAQREIILKLVYYGPPLSGKTTNLMQLHKLLGSDLTGHLTTLNTADDRTLFFDLLPVVLQSETGHRIKLKLFTVPGQVIHAATRRIVLAGADAVAFIADSQLSEAKTNNEYWHGMRQYLADSGIDPDTVPRVVQFNKRDKADIRSDAELETVRRQGKEPIFKAVAIRGEGVIETLHGLLTETFASLNQRYDFENKFSVSIKSLLSTLFASQHISPNAAVG